MVQTRKPVYKRIRKYLRERVKHGYNYLDSLIHASKYRESFEQLETFCLFVGYPRSGHSLVGALLDAHENIVMAHELNALRLIKLGYDRSQLFYLIKKNADSIARRGRVTSGFNYNVPNQWQGRHDTIKVVGDKKGGGSTRILMHDAEAIQDLREIVGVEIKCIHVVRNPFDNISTIARRRRHRFDYKVRPIDLEESIEFYFKRASTNEALKNSGEIAVHDLRHEDLISDPRTTLEHACIFLGVKPDRGYLDDCAGIIYEKPNRSRNAVEWPAELRARVEEGISKLSFLEGYSFES